MTDITFSIDDSLAAVYAVPENQTKLQQLVEYSLRQLASNPELDVTDLAEMVLPSTPSSLKKERVLGVQQRTGQYWMAEDFDAELPDSFWLGEDDHLSP